MPHWRGLIPADHLKAADFAGREVTLTIVSVGPKQIDKLVKPGKKADPNTPPAKEKRGVVVFKETEKTLPLNVTNAASMAAMWGDDYAKWAGHRITLFSGRDNLGAEEVDAIRVKGSPDLEKPIAFDMKRPHRKTPVRVRLVPTGKNAPTMEPDVSAPVEEPAPAEEPATDRIPGADDDAA